MLEPQIDDFFRFVQRAPTSWHAVEWVREKLEAAGYRGLDEGTKWEVESGGRYYVIRSGSIAAFSLPSGTPRAIRLAGAHTDSPALKVKPQAEYRVENMTMLGMEVYGGPLLSSWLNRDLAIAGQVAYVNKAGELTEGLVHLTQHPVVVPQLAIHLDRAVNTEGLKLDRQKHLAALAAVDHEGDFLDPLLVEALGDCQEILSRELFLVPMEPPRLIAGGKLMNTWRVDNLGSVHAALTGLLAHDSAHADTIRMIAFWDHEEVGSNSAMGAASPFFSDIMERLSLSLGITRESQLEILARSLCLSIDAAHALHPNYTDVHEPRHQPLLCKGTTLKVNAQQRYSGGALPTAQIEKLCRDHKLPLQKYVNRTDMPCGSTIGPIHSTRTGMSTVDVGYPQLSMHSVRELAACSDHIATCELSKVFFL